MLRLEIDGRTVHGRADETLLEIARGARASRSRTCATSRGWRRPATAAPAWSRSTASACWRRRAAARRAGMKVRTDSARARRAQKLVLELLLADMPAAPRTRDDELRLWADRLGIARPRFEPRARGPAAPDLSHPAIAVNLDACIQCTRCVRACRDEQVNDVIGWPSRRAGEDRVRPGRPDGRVHLRGLRRMRAGLPDRRADAGQRRRLQPAPERTVDSVCPFCGVGCQLTYTCDGNRRRRAGARRPANHGRLCVKGRFGFDYAHHPQRLTVPLVRRADAPSKDPIARGEVRRLSRVAAVPRGELGRGAGARRRRPEGDPRCARRAGAGRLRLGQGQQRGGLPVPEAGAHRLRHPQRRPLHAPVPRLVGGGAARGHRLRRGVSNPVRDVAQAELVLLIGANPAVNHPVAASWIKNAVRAGTTLVCADPKRTELARHAPGAPAVPRRHRRRAAQRDAARDRRRGPGRRGLRAPSAPRASRRCARTCAATAPRPWRRSAASRGDDPRGGARLRDQPRVDDPVGHGHEPARARHRQRALPDRAGAGDRPDRPPRHRAAPAARPEQRAGRVRRRPDPDDAARLPARERRRGARALRAGLGAGAGCAARPARADGGRDHARRAAREDPRHARHGREPGHVRPRREPRARGAGGARSPGGAGHLPDRDRGAGRRRAAGQRLPREDRQLHQHRPPGADRPRRRAAAGAGAAGPVDHPGDRQRDRAVAGRYAMRPRSSTRCAA
jgi:ferredoxin